MFQPAVTPPLVLEPEESSDRSTDWASTLGQLTRVGSSRAPWDMSGGHLKVEAVTMLRTLRSPEEPHPSLLRLIKSSMVWEIKFAGGGRIRRHQKGFGGVTSITRHHGEVAIISLTSSVILRVRIRVSSRNVVNAPGSFRARGAAVASGETGFVLHRLTFFVFTLISES